MAHRRGFNQREGGGVKVPHLCLRGITACRGLFGFKNKCLLCPIPTVHTSLIRSFVLFRQSSAYNLAPAHGTTTGRLTKWSIEHRTNLTSAMEYNSRSSRPYNFTPVYSYSPCPTSIQLTPCFTLSHASHSILPPTRTQLLLQTL